MKKILISAVTLVIGVAWAVVAFAEDAAAIAPRDIATPWLAVASGFGVAIAAFGGALGQSKAAVAALEGIARNPSASGKILAPMIIALALIESLVIYALVVAFLLQGKI